MNSDKIPTAIIVTGPNITSQELLFSRLTKKLQQGAIPITLRSGDAINLKTVLKKLIRDATNEVHEDEDEPRRTGPNAANNGRKLLNYDLQILYNYLQSLPERKAVVVTFQDTDAIDSALLCQLIELFKYDHRLS